MTWAYIACKKYIRTSIHKWIKGRWLKGINDNILFQFQSGRGASYKNLVNDVFSNSLYNWVSPCH